MTELVLRGIFLLRKKEIDWLYQGPGKHLKHFEYKFENEIEFFLKMRIITVIVGVIILILLQKVHKINKILMLIL